MTKIIQTLGKRKRAVARATLKPGKGIIRINSKLLSIYQPDLARYKIMEPLQLAKDLANKVNINVNVYGGGWQAQSEATRLAIAKGLVEFSGSKDLKQTFLDYDRHLLVQDVRHTESSKPNDSSHVIRGKKVIDNDLGERIK